MVVINFTLNVVLLCHMISLLTVASVSSILAFTLQRLFPVKWGKMGPWNVEDGLPTLEQDRNLPIDVQAMHLFASGLIVT